MELLVGFFMEKWLQLTMHVYGFSSPKTVVLVLCNQFFGGHGPPHDLMSHTADGLLDNYLEWVWRAKLWRVMAGFGELESEQNIQESWGGRWFWPKKVPSFPASRLLLCSSNWWRGVQGSGAFLMVFSRLLHGWCVSAFSAVEQCMCVSFNEVISHITTNRSILGKNKICVCFSWLR